MDVQGQWMLVYAVVAMAGTAGAVNVPTVQYDQRIERAAAAIVARRMGELRGGLDIGFRVHPPQHSQPVNRSSPASRQPRAGVWQDGLAIAIEKKTTVSPDL